MTSASISQYLLEKSRLPFQEPGERNFHVFYQLTKGAPASLKGQLSLASPESFNYLNKSGSLDADGINDVGTNPHYPFPTVC